jgi:hypothetical protein
MTSSPIGEGSMQTLGQQIAEASRELYGLPARGILGEGECQIALRVLLALRYDATIETICCRGSLSSALA